MYMLCVRVSNDVTSHLTGKGAKNVKDVGAGLYTTVDLAAGKYYVVCSVEDIKFANEADKVPPNRRSYALRIPSEKGDMWVYPRYVHAVYCPPTTVPNPDHNHLIGCHWRANFCRCFTGLTTVSKVTLMSKFFRQQQELLSKWICQNL